MTDKNKLLLLLIIGNEVLSGRTQDKNLAFVGNALGEIGIDMKEVRIVPDEQDEIVDAVNALRAKYTYVFTSGALARRMTILPLIALRRLLVCRWICIRWPLNY